MHNVVQMLNGTYELPAAEPSTAATRRILKAQSTVGSEIHEPDFDTLIHHLPGTLDLPLDAREMRSDIDHTAVADLKEPVVDDMLTMSAGVVSTPRSSTRNANLAAAFSRTPIVRARSPQRLATPMNVQKPLRLAASGVTPCSDTPMPRSLSFSPGHPVGVRQPG